LPLLGNRSVGGFFFLLILCRLIAVADVNNAIRVFSTSNGMPVFSLAEGIQFLLSFVTFLRMTLLFASLSFLMKEFNAFLQCVPFLATPVNSPVSCLLLLHVIPPTHKGERSL
jgi:hypothetical protein